jgi:vacuolar-type H+-ATPase subunit E/Vma4
MTEDLFLLAVYTTVILAAFCIVGIIAELILNYQERNEISIVVGSCLKSRAKKCKLTTTMRNILAKLRFN